MKPVLFADDPSFWYEALRTLGHAAYGGADIGEVLTTCAAITEGDYDSWHDEWLATADRVSGEAEKMLAAGHRISARDGLMRANNYYRAAEFFLHGNPADPRIDHAYQRSRECFAPPPRSSILRSSPSKSLMREQFCMATSTARPEAAPSHAQR